MITNYNLSNLLAYNKNLISVQTFADLFVQLNTAGCAFDVTNGLGNAANVSTWVLANYAVKNTTGHVVLQYPSPTTAGTEDLGVPARVTNMKTGQENYYYFRQHNQVASIGKVIAGAAIVTLTSGAFAVPQGQLFTIDLTCNGPNLSATFTSSGVTTRNLAIADTDIPGAGLFGFRSLSKAVWCSLMQFNQLPG